MSDTKKVLKFKFTTSNGRESSMTVNVEPINNTLTDPDSEEPLWPDAVASIMGAWESDDGASIATTSIDVVQTTTFNVASDYTPST